MFRVGRARVESSIRVDSRIPAHQRCYRRSHFMTMVVEVGSSRRRCVAIWLEKSSRGSRGVSIPTIPSHHVPTLFPLRRLKRLLEPGKSERQSRYIDRRDC